MKLNDLIALDAKYPAQRWWAMLDEDEPDCAGPAATPEAALEMLRQQYDTDTVQEQIDDCRVTIGMHVDDAALLLHLDALVNAGVPLEKAQALTAELKERLNSEVEPATADEFWPGMKTVYDVIEEGDLQAVVL